MLALLLAAFSALAAPAAAHTTSIDLFEDPSLDKLDWKAARRGPWTKPYIGWTIDAGQGDGIVDFGDVRFRDEVVTGFRDVDVVMTIRINGIDDYVWVAWDEEEKVNLRLVSRPKNPNVWSSDPSTQIWVDQPGFYIWDHEITNLKVTGLPYASSTQIEVVWLAVTGTHDSMASHGLTHCVGTDLIIDKSGAITPFKCGGTDLKLMAIGSQLIQAFPNAPAVAPTTTKPECDDPTPEELFQQFLPTAPTRGVEGRFDKADVPGPK